MAKKNGYREGFASLGEFLAATVIADTGGEIDPKLPVSAAATGANEKVPSEGGFAIPGEFAADLWSAVYDTGSILDRCGRQPLTIGDRLTIPAIDESSRADG